MQLLPRQHVEQVVHFGVHFAGRGHRVADLRPEQLSIPLAQAVHRHLDRPLLHAQHGREFRVRLRGAVAGRRFKMAATSSPNRISAGLMPVPPRAACNNPESSLDMGTTPCRGPFAKTAKTRTPPDRTFSHVHEVISPHRNPQPSASTNANRDSLRNSFPP
jgi:hypothetical protein